MGVPSLSHPSILRAFRMDSSGDFHRHAIRSPPTLDAFIWSRGEYLVFARSPPYTGHSPAVRAGLGEFGASRARAGTEQARLSATAVRRRLDGMGRSLLGALRLKLAAGFAKGAIIRWLP